MDEEIKRFEKKTKLILLVEMLIFVVLFLVLATLEILHIIGKNPTMQTIFNWVTIFGGAWIIVDFFWVLFSKKRRAKNSLLDKALALPAAIYIITFDIICFCKLSFVDTSFRQLMIGILFYYFAAIYLFQAIYHWFYPLPAVKEAVKEAAEQLKKEQEEMQNQQGEADSDDDDHAENADGPSD